MTNLSLGLEDSLAELRAQACERAGIDPEALRGLRVARRSLDARRTSGGGRRFRYVIHADLTVDAGYTGVVFENAKRAGLIRACPPPESLTVPEGEVLRPGRRVAVIGSGPAGLFAAMVLARSGCSVDLVERGGSLRERARSLAKFFNSRVPDFESNLLFGEGGAGTYSDGKLYTRVDHPLAAPILSAFVEAGAPADIVFDARAHIGTDRLHRILPIMREGLERLGVRFHWNTRFEGFEFDEVAGVRRVRALRTARGEIPCDAAVLAVGHSARDTWSVLLDQGIEIEARASQLGVRIEHPQDLINLGRYGEGSIARDLGHSYYGLVCRADKQGPGGYSFCMCPGGQIVASVNSAGHLCTNGMSNSLHSSGWANAAIVTAVGPREFGNEPFAGVDYQRDLEARFFEAGGGDYGAPAQRASDFIAGRTSPSGMRTSYKFGVVPARIDELLPEGIRDALRKALLAFERQIPGFAGEEGILVGVETRCSAPLRMTRDPERFCATGIDNLYPVGEGAGYAGGILSAAIDGARAAQAMLRFSR